jgi:predicted nucleic acid-binding Zn ribbon protein
MRIPFKRGALFFGLFQTNFLNSISFLIETMENKTCLNCGEPIRGRVDKKFCDDQCRNNYNYHQYADANNLMRRINHTLKKNRNILESLIPQGEDLGKAPKEKLVREGFQFKYSTHSYETKKGSVYTYCYDYGYLPLEGDWFLIVRVKE